MSRSLRSFVAGIGLALGLGLVAVPLVRTVDAAAPATKIGIIDLERMLYDTPAGKRASDAFEKSLNAKRAEVDKQKKDLIKANAELEKQAAVLKPDKLAEKKGALEKQFVALQETAVKLERSLAEERTKLIQGLLKKAEPVIEEIARSEGVDMIIDKQAVIWSQPAVDLTAKLNAKMK